MELIRNQILRRFMRFTFDNRKILFSSFILFTVFTCFGVENQLDTATKQEPYSLPTSIQLDTLRVKNIESIKEGRTWYEDEKMPWIIAVVVSIAGIIINLWISNSQIKSNRQLSLKQIEATLSANNRQEWITETRNTLTQLLTFAKQLNVEFQEKKNNVEIKKALHEKVTINRTKLILLLNIEKNELHKNLYKSMYELINILDVHFNNQKAKFENNIIIPNDNGKFLEQMEKVIEDGRKLFYDEWRKIQSVTD
jgi:hypothetical protein